MTIQILANILKFLERVTVSGNEAYAWCEAHQHIQNQINTVAQEQIANQTRSETATNNG